MANETIIINDLTTVSKDYSIVKLAQIKQHLRIQKDNYEDDNYLDSLRKVATKDVENYVQKDVALTTKKFTQNQFTGSRIQLPDGFLNTVDSISYTSINSTGSTVLSGGTGYQLLTCPDSFTIYFNSDIDCTDLTINYKTGFDYDSLHTPIRQAILISIGSLYDVVRSEYVMGSIKKEDVLPRLLNSYKRLDIY